VDQPALTTAIQRLSTSFDLQLDSVMILYYGHAASGAKIAKDSLGKFEAPNPKFETNSNG